ncbi:hypothetical protein SAMN05216238_10211 [Lentibacillus persicus]|uniref:Uncharacterized protein n=1 Tax=Lentibacillus persicus TaxID=640948 RepID=A0A1I1T628_9BACI|nr:hypothetical protein SAMN05216238_10211 [Lentibacillus persicus]
MILSIRKGAAATVYIYRFSPKENRLILLHI